MSSEIRESGIRVGFYLEGILTHATGSLAHVKQKTGPRVGKYHVNLEDIEHIAVTAIQRSIIEADVIVVDELGPMELNSNAFVKAVREALAAPKHFLGTIHKRASHEIIVEIKNDPTFQIVELTSESRNEIPREITEKILS